ncbi:NUDIX domain-containing protein [Lachnoclostridium phytofermentans]|uniref:NUDIX hydrolase n=1 Tax=Lachnoclostridium phytofermentans (strain ATCC 700394 / DSM 18823 / ISDg) TaxID=357809 RepID=A9KR12_LACP7|nr:NUDIX domain-containing protein [Lachnoclostridium phytofermentans]ABX43491.1 NUDIX hydrolase [Lachnoclostridium phytofermentans ISDg]
MHKIFGEKINVEYTDRKGAYLIPIKESKIGVVKTSKGYFLLGGGIEQGESDEMCIIRECMEEIGYEVVIKKRVCSAETYSNHYSSHPTIKYFHPIQTYYSGTLLEQKQLPIEKDHCLEWVDYEDLKGNLFVKMQNWALDECWKIL